MKRIEVVTPHQKIRLVEIISIETRPIMAGDYVLRKEVWTSLGPDGRYKYGDHYCKALFDRRDNQVTRSYSSNYKEYWAIGQKNEKILENCVAIKFVDDRLNEYYSIKTIL